MGAAVPIVAAAFTVGGTIYSVSQQRKEARQQERAAAEAEKIGRENAAIIEAETREEVKRAKLQDAATSGKARALAGASGLKTEGSISTFLSDLDTAQKDSLSWLAKSGESRSRIAELTGQYTASQGRAGATGTRAQAAGTLAGGVGSVYNIGNTQNWWN